jgi:glycosyltransferase involved in cell wall biosynthesis
MIWCLPHPTHYHTYLLERLAHLDEARIRVVHFHRKLAQYPWTTSFEGAVPVSYLRRRLGVDWGFLMERIRSPSELVGVAGWNEPTMLLMLWWFSAVGRPFLLWTDTPNPRPRHWLKKWLRHMSLQPIFRHVFRYLVTGRPGMENARLLGVPPDRIVNFPFATNTAVFHPAAPRGPRDESAPVAFISSGRLDNSHKGYDLAVEAFSLVKQRHPELRFHYVIVGDGPDRAALRSLIAAKGLTTEIDLAGWLEPEELPAFYRSADVFLHPSHFDPFPNAVLEAMASGLPIVGSEAAGSVADRVVEGETGHVHAPGDVEDLYRKLVLMLRQTPQQRMEMGARARQTAIKWSVEYNAGVVRDVIAACRTVSAAR